MLDEDIWKITIDEDVLVEVGKIQAFAMLWFSRMLHRWSGEIAGETGKDLILENRTHLCSTLNIIFIYMINSCYHCFSLKGSEIPLFSVTPLTSK